VDNSTNHPLLDALEDGPWPRFVADMKKSAATTNLSVRDLYDIVKVKCPECGVVKKLSLDKGENTWCIDCQTPVIWEKIDES